MHTWWAEDTSFKNIKHGSVIATKKKTKMKKSNKHFAFLFFYIFVLFSS